MRNWMNRGHRGNSAGRDANRPPPTQNWPSYGQPRQEIRGESGFGGETPANWRAEVIEYGQEYGAARVDHVVALGPDAAPNQFVAGALGVRKGVAKEDSLRRGIDPAQRITSAPARKAKAKAKDSVIGQRLVRLKSEKLPFAAEKVNECKREAVDAWATYQEMPRIVRGYFKSLALLVLIELAVVLFDVFVIRTALENSGMSPLSAWGTSATLPLAVFAINHALGMLAGAIGERIPPESRLKVAVSAFGATMLPLVIAFVLLAAFRSAANDAMNAALQAIAEGAPGVDLQVYLPLWWMAPIQIAGSFAAILAVALWTMSRDGRTFLKDVVRPAEQALAAAEAQLAAVEAEIERTHREQEAAVLVEHDIEADALAAQVEVDAEEDILEAKLEAEDALAAAMTAHYEATFTYTDKVFENGGVWRVALPTDELFWGKRRQRPPENTRREASPDMGSNGHTAGRPLDPRDLNPIT